VRTCVRLSPHVKDRRIALAVYRFPHIRAWPQSAPSVLSVGEFRALSRATRLRAVAPRARAAANTTSNRRGVRVQLSLHVDATCAGTLLIVRAVAVYHLGRWKGEISFRQDSRRKLSGPTVSNFRFELVKALSGLDFRPAN